LVLGLKQGRTFNATDTADHPKVVIINEATARNFWGSQSPVGKRISSTGKQRDYYEIVGVVNDLAFPGDLGEPYTRFEAFVPITQRPPNYLTIGLRTSINPRRLVTVSGIQLPQSLPIYQSTEFARPELLLTRASAASRCLGRCSAHLLWLV
jgi:hypothetical protein